MENPPEGTPERLSEYLTRHLNSLILSVNSLKDTVRLWNKNGFTGNFIGNLTGNVVGNVAGNVAGNLSGNVAGNSFAFPATQVSSSDVNTLDDYEEGTWTPTLTGFTFVGAQTNTFTYTKIGRIVFISISLHGATSVAATGSATITLPSFTAVTVGSGNMFNHSAATSHSVGLYSGNLGLVTAVPATDYLFFSGFYFTST